MTPHSWLEALGLFLAGLLVVAGWAVAHKLVGKVLK